MIASSAVERPTNKNSITVHIPNPLPVTNLLQEGLEFRLGRVPSDRAPNAVTRLNGTRVEPTHSLPERGSRSLSYESRSSSISTPSHFANIISFAPLPHKFKKASNGIGIRNVEIVKL